MGTGRANDEVENAAADEDDREWSTRSLHWLQVSTAATTKWRVKRLPEKPPLILTGNNIALTIDAGTLLVRNGFTHYPQLRETLRFFKGDVDLPSRIIILDASGSVTFDVISWLAEQGVSLVRINWAGEVVAVISGYGYSANQHRVAWQHELRSDEHKQMGFCNKLIERKIEGCILTLEKSVRRSPAWETAVKRAYADLTELELRPPRDVASLRTLEANSAATYFRAWRTIALRWHPSSRHPIPDDWRAIGSRTSRFNLAGNRNASHPVNAILNYAYAVLQSRLHIQAVSEGYDPTLGIMHFDRDASPAFVFDLMEPERSKIDRVVIEFLKAETLHPGDFTIRDDGVVRLNPQLARHVAKIASEIPISLRA